MMLPLVLTKPLVFGDEAQINALKLMAEKEDFDEVADCGTCDGTGEVTIECEDCDGEGKDFDALEAHRKKYPL